MTILLNDPIWQFVGAFAGILTLGATVYFYWLQPNRKSLSCEITTDTELESLNHSICSRVKELHEAAVIEEMHFILFSVVNDGTIPITAAHFEQPLVFNFGQSTTILHVGVAHVSPTNLTPKLSVSPHQIHLSPLLLNSRDTIQISVLLSQPNEKFCVKARIEGIHQVNNRIHMPASSFEKAIKTGLLSLLIVLIPISVSVPSFRWVAAVIGFFLVVRRVPFEHISSQFIVNQIEKLLDTPMADSHL